MKGITANENVLFIMHARTIDNIKTTTSNFPRERTSTPLPTLRDKLLHVTQTAVLRHYINVSS